jgi:hypothetical protein
MMEVYYKLRLQNLPVLAAPPLRHSTFATLSVLRETVILVLIQVAPSSTEQEE